PQKVAKQPPGSTHGVATQAGQVHYVAALESTLYRCRALVGRIGEELRKKKPEHFVDERSSLADPSRLPILPPGRLRLATFNEVTPVQLELLHELVPTATVMALVVNPASPARAESNTRQAQVAARRLGLKLHVLHAGSEQELDAALANAIQLRAR